jgi:hypothetical protein
MKSAYVYDLTASFIRSIWLPRVAVKYMEVLVLLSRKFRAPHIHFCMKQVLCREIKGLHQSVCYSVLKSVTGKVVMNFKWPRKRWHGNINHVTVRDIGCCTNKKRQKRDEMVLCLYLTLSLLHFEADANSKTQQKSCCHTIRHHYIL